MSARKQTAVVVTPTNSNTRVSNGRPLAGASSRVLPASGLPRAINSNTRISVGLLTPAAAAAPASPSGASEGWAMRQRQRMVERLRESGIRDEQVLKAMGRTPRHRFVDEAFASRAYENDALPIGSGQTISQPRVVAHMISLARAGRTLSRVLEVGTGCGYQAAVLAEVAREVYTMERVKALYEQARRRLQHLRVSGVRVLYGDGGQGWSNAAPFDAIIVAAAGMSLPQALFEQLAIGGRLVAPEGGDEQRLVVIERRAPDRWHRTELEAVRFVPLKSGVQL